MVKKEIYQKVLFIGNGINNIENSQSWGRLVSELRKRVNKNKEAKDVIKQFPLLFESFLSYGLRNGSINKESDLKTIVAKEVQLIERHQILNRIDEVNPKHIITTNYDFVLEKGLTINDTSVYKDPVYSTFRRFTATENGRIFWHIHGDCGTETSINLGYEHYGGQLQKMRNFLINGYPYHGLNIKPIRHRMNSLSNNPDSWVDLFFKIDIHIIGLSLDFIEIDLWWLLAYRAKWLNKSNRKVHNNIYYYIPLAYLQDSKGKLELMHNLGVRVRALDGEKETYYNNVFDIITGKTNYHNVKNKVKNSLIGWIDEIID